MAIPSAVAPTRRAAAARVASAWAVIAPGSMSQGWDLAATPATPASRTGRGSGVKEPLLR